MPTSIRPKFGVKDLVYALLTESSDVSGGTPAYGTIKSLAGLGKISVAGNSNMATIYGDDMPQATADMSGKLDVDIELADIDHAALAEVLGNTYSNGQVLENIDHQSPYIALGFKISRTGGYFDYVWLYKGKLMKPDLGGETRKESINFQAVQLKGTFIPLLANKNLRIRLRTDDSAVPAATLAGFFTTIPLTAATDMGALTLTSGAGAVSSKTLTLTFAKAGGGTTTIQVPAQADFIQMFIDSSKAMLTPQSWTPGGASATPTLAVVFSTMTAVAHTVVVTTGVKDANGISCVAKAIAVTPA